MPALEREISVLQQRISELELPRCQYDCMARRQASGEGSFMLINNNHYERMAQSEIQRISMNTPIMKQIVRSIQGTLVLWMVSQGLERVMHF